MLALGISLSDIAESLSFTKEMARSHLKSVYRKTGVFRQSELIRLVQGVAKFDLADVEAAYRR